MSRRRALDDLARFNKERWEELAQAGVEYSRPLLDLDPVSAHRMLDPAGVMGDVTELRALCLAAGGGQQSVAFALLGAHVTVFDLSDTQLGRDRLAAEHYGMSIEIVQGDMRDLDCFDDDAFDIVYQAYSLNFVPDVRPVHAEVARVLQPGGLYRLEWGNPFTQMVDEAGWTGNGYLLGHPYIDGREVNDIFPEWDVTDQDGNLRKIRGPREYVHSLSTMVNSLAAHDFVVIHAREDAGDDPAAKPGSWPHFMRVAVPYLTFWSRYLPGTIRPNSGQGG